jgi:hypothetical protein
VLNVSFPCCLELGKVKPSHDVLRPSSESMTIASKGFAVSGAPIWRRSFTGIWSVAICITVMPESNAKTAVTSICWLLRWSKAEIPPTAGQMPPSPFSWGQASAPPADVFWKKADGGLYGGIKAGHPLPLCDPRQSDHFLRRFKADNTSHKNQMIKGYPI